MINFRDYICRWKILCFLGFIIYDWKMLFYSEFVDFVYKMVLMF